MKEWSLSGSAGKAWSLSESAGQGWSLSESTEKEILLVNRELMIT